MLWGIFLMCGLASAQFLNRSPRKDRGQWVIYWLVYCAKHEPLFHKMVRNEMAQLKTESLSAAKGIFSTESSRGSCITVRAKSTVGGRWDGWVNAMSHLNTRDRFVFCVYSATAEAACWWLIIFIVKKKKNLFSVTLPLVSWFHSWRNNPSLLMPGVSVTAALILHYLSLTHKLFWCCPRVEPRVFWFFSLHQMKPPQICSFGSKAAFGTIRFDSFVFFLLQTLLTDTRHRFYCPRSFCYW